MNQPSIVFDKLKKAASAEKLDISPITGAVGQLYNWDVSKIYVERVERLFKQYQQETDVDLLQHANVEALTTFAYWLAHKRILTCTPNTWRSYRSALIAVITHDKFREILLDAKPPSVTEQPRRTSRKRAKHVSPKQLAKLTAYLSQSKSQYSEEASRWIAVTLCVGLRPKEWMNASIVYKHDLPVLRVINAKRNENTFTDSQGILLKRCIPLWHLDEVTIDLVSTHIDFVIDMFETIGQFEKYYERLRHYIATSVMRSGYTVSGGRTFSLYTCRQQFACNLKASPIEKSLKAYFMGHKDYATMKNHYGKVRSGVSIMSLSQTQTNMLLELRESDIS